MAGSSVPANVPSALPKTGGWRLCPKRLLRVDRGDCHRFSSRAARGALPKTGGWRLCPKRLLRVDRGDCHRFSSRLDGGASYGFPSARREHEDRAKPPGLPPPGPPARFFRRFPFCARVLSPLYWV